MTIADRIDLGFFPLQDHAAARDGVAVSTRLSLAGARITKLQTEGSNAADSILEYGRANGLGTLGDIHPWAFWQTRDRATRGCGLWTQSLGVLVTSADAIYGTNSTEPLRDADWLTDTRLRPASVAWPAGFPTLARGSLLIALPGTEEGEQHVLGYWADPRLIAPNAAGPGEAGTIVCDLGPSNEICMAGSETPGIGGRHARLQSLVRVIAVSPGSGFANIGGPGNVLALNYTTSQQDQVAGVGAVFGRLAAGGGGPTTRSADPAAGTGAGRATLAHEASTGRARSGEPDIGAGAFGAGLGSDLTDEGAPSSTAPNGFGTFTPQARGGHGVGLMASADGFGPIHLGHANDKHLHGFDADGHPINAAHVSTNAYFFRDRTYDAPLLFEGDYPGASGFPLQAITHLTYDGGTQHPFAGGTRAGIWRWWTEVPFYAPPTGGPPPPTTPGRGRGGGPGRGGGGGPPTPGGGRGGGPGPGRGGGPGGPGGGGPVTPGGGGGRGGGGGGPGGPGGPNPGKGRGRGPTTPGGKTKDDGKPKGKPQGEPQRPKYPWSREWPRGGSTGDGGSGDPTKPSGPAGPKTGPGGGGDGGGEPNDPSGPTTPGGGATGPTGPVTPGGGICGVVPPTSDPNSSQDDQTTAPLPSTRLTMGDLVPLGSVLYGGPGGGGTMPTDSRLAFGRLSGRDPHTYEEQRVPGLVERVGGADRDSVGLYSIFHPLHETFAAVSFRPQLAVLGAVNYEHNPQVPAKLIGRDEAVRPQVLTMRAFGGVAAATGDWAYVEAPASSRARGGTANGGLVLSPPRFEAEDYFAINSGANVSDTTSSRATTSYFLAAPGVAFALGLPTIAGGVDANSVVIRQDVTVATKPLVVEHDTVELLRGYTDGSETHFEIGGTTAVQVPAGTTAQRPATPVVGHLRINTDSTPVVEWWDGSAWVTAGGGGGGTSIRVDENGTLKSNRPEINFIGAGNAVVTVVDNGGSSRADITVAVYNTAAIDAIEATTPATDELPYYDSASSAATTPLTSFARTLLDDVDAAEARATLELDTAYGDAPIAGTTLNTTYADLCSKVLTLAAGDQIEIEVAGTILNNSGAVATYRWQLAIGSMTLEIIDGTTVAASATNRAPFHIRARAAVLSTSSAGCTMTTERSVPGAVNTGLSTAATTIRMGHQVSASDLTGAQTCELRMRSSTATATQTATVHSWKVTQIPSRP